MSTLSVLFGKRIARERQALGWSQSALARKAGIPGKNLGGYERGENQPGVFTAASIAEALGVSLGALVAPSPCEVCDGMPPARMICGACRKEGTP